MTLRVIVQVVPFGEEDKTYEIGRLDIFNKGRIGFAQCEYGVIDLGPEPGLFVQDVIHRRDYGAWELIRKAIEELEITGP